MEAFVIAALCGVVVGILSGLLGIGGGTIMVPIFRLGFDMSALASTGTSLFTMIFTSAAGSVTHVRNGTCILPLGLLAGVCGALMSPFGVRLANMSPAWLVMLATAVVIAYTAVTMLRKGLAMPKPGSEGASVAAEHGSQAQAGQSAHEEQSALEEQNVHATEQNVHEEQNAHATEQTLLLKAADLSRKQYLIGALAGVAAGFAGGYVGLGGGFLMVPIFLAGVGLSMKQASGTSLLAVSILAAAGSFAQASFGNVEVLAGLAMAIGSIPGAILGATFIKRIPERNLRILFGAFLILTATFLAVNELFLQG